MIEMTEQIDAINEILLAIGEEPVESIDNMSDNLDAVTAMRCLKRVLANIQTDGYSWNSLDAVTMTPDSDTKRIRWNSSWLMLRNSDDTTMILRPKDGYVYNVAYQTFEFSASFTASIIKQVPFEELPYCWRNYVIQRASYLFASRFLGDANLQQLLAQDVTEAWSKCNAYEIEVGQANMFNNASITEVLTRS